MRLCRGFGVYGMGGTSFSIYLLFPPWIQKKIRASPRPESLTGYVIIYPRRMYPANLTGISEALLSFSFQTATRGSLGGGRRCTNCHGRRQVVRYTRPMYPANLTGVSDALFSFWLQTATRGSLGGGRRCTNCHGRRQVVRYTRPKHLRAAMPPQPHARNVRARPDRRRRE